MGCGGSTPTPPDGSASVAEEQSKTPQRAVDSQFSKEDATLPEGWPEGQPVGKVLLLGGGETGKSTILKQMHLLYGQRDSLDANLFKMWMKRNVVECAHAIVKFMDDRGEDDASLKLDAKDREMLLEFDKEGKISADEGVKLAALWKKDDSVLKRAMEVNRSDPSHWILDQAPFFFEHAERIAADGYEPDTTDIVKTRVLTVGINTVSFIDEVDCAYLTQFLPAAASLVAPEDVDKSNTQLPWQMIDVGGQRGERRKWMSALDDVLCLVYTVGLIEYQQIMYEDTKTVRSSHARLARRTFVGCPPCALAPRAWLYACARA
jgi:guanine nucleotide-binding protein subunit alpha